MAMTWQRHPQDGPKMASMGPQDGHNMAPIWLQDGPKRLQDGFKRPQDGPKLAPCWPQKAPEWPQEGSEKALRNQTSTYKNKCRMPRRSEGYARTAIISWARLERGRLRIHVPVATRPDPARPDPTGHFDPHLPQSKIADLGPSVLAAPAKILEM